MAIHREWILFFVLLGLAALYRRVLTTFLRWTTRQSVMAIMSAALLAVIYGYAGTEYGLPGLFWHENPLTQFFAGVGACLFFNGIVYTSYIVNEDKAGISGDLEKLPPWMKFNAVIRAFVPPPAKNLAVQNLMRRPRRFKELKSYAKFYVIVCLLISSIPFAISVIGPEEARGGRGWTLAALLIAALFTASLCLSRRIRGRGLRQSLRLRADMSLYLVLYMLPCLVLLVIPIFPFLRGFAGTSAASNPGIGWPWLCGVLEGEIVATLVTRSRVLSVINAIVNYFFGTKFYKLVSLLGFCLLLIIPAVFVVDRIYFGNALKEGWWSLAFSMPVAALALALAMMKRFSLHASFPDKVPNTMDNNILVFGFCLPLIVAIAFAVNVILRGELPLFGAPPGVALAGSLAGLALAVAYIMPSLRLNRLILKETIDFNHKTYLLFANPMNLWIWNLLLLGIGFLFISGDDETTFIDTWFCSGFLICLLLSILTTSYAFVAFHAPVWQIPILLALLALVLNDPAQKYRFRGMGGLYDRQALIPLEPDRNGIAAPVPVPRMLADEVARRAWKGRQGEKPRLVIVATSGGGMRAAVWTAAVLRRLEKVMPAGFPYQIRLVTGASGGMVGAASYVSMLNPPNLGDEIALMADFGRDSLPDALGDDYLTPVTRRLILHDLPRLICPVTPSRRDRGEELEGLWEQATGRAQYGRGGASGLRRTFSDLAIDERAGWCPSLIFTPMMLEDGRRLIISNLDLDFLAHSEGPALGRPAGEAATYSRSALEFFKLFPREETAEFRLSTAARMSATFPFMIPAVALPTNPPRRLVDAGFYDNYGVNVAAGWLRHNRDWLKCNTSGVVLIQIHTWPMEFDLISRVGRDEQSLDLVNRGWAWLSSFPTGVEKARKSTVYRNDEQVAMLSRDFNEQDPNKPKPARDFFTTVVFECPAEAGLSLYLSHAERDTIIDGIADDGPIKTLDRIKAIRPDLAKEISARQLRGKLLAIADEIDLLDSLKNVTGDVEKQLASYLLTVNRNLHRLKALQEWWAEP